MVLNATHMMWQGLVWTISGLTAASAPAGAETAEWYGDAHDADGLLGNGGGAAEEKPEVGSGLWFFYLFISIFLVCMAGTVAGMTIVRPRRSRSPEANLPARSRPSRGRARGARAHARRHRGAERAQ